MSHLTSVIRTILSLSYIKHIINYWGHNVFESVLWRLRINGGEEIRVHPTASIRNPHNVYVGKNSHINLNCCVWAGKTSKIVLGDNLLMGPCVQLHASKHGTDIGCPMTFQELTYKDIVIGDDVWLCAGCIITAGVKIANGVIVAANAVVTKSIEEEYVIVAGIPAKIITKRK